MSESIKQAISVHKREARTVHWAQWDSIGLGISEDLISTPDHLHDSARSLVLLVNRSLGIDDFSDDNFDIQEDMTVRGTRIVIAALDYGQFFVLAVGGSDVDRKLEAVMGRVMDDEEDDDANLAYDEMTQGNSAELANYIRTHWGRA